MMLRGWQAACRVVVLAARHAGAASSCRSSLLPKKHQTPNRVILTASFIWEIRIASACCYGNAGVKGNDLIMIYDEIPLGWACCPSMLAVGGTRLGDAWPWCGGPGALPPLCLPQQFVFLLVFSLWLSRSEKLLLLEQPFPLEISSEVVAVSLLHGVLSPFGRVTAMGTGSHQ